MRPYCVGLLSGFCDCILRRFAPLLGYLHWHFSQYVGATFSACFTSILQPVLDVFLWKAFGAFLLHFLDPVLRLSSSTFLEHLAAVSSAELVAFLSMQSGLYIATLLLYILATFRQPSTSL